jgi:hypothetical protein
MHTATMLLHPPQDTPTLEKLRTQYDKFMAGDFDDIELTVTQEGPLSPQGIIDQWIASHQAEAGTLAVCYDMFLMLSVAHACVKRFR